jgi:hypothetical protein
MDRHWQLKVSEVKRENAHTKKKLVCWPPVPLTTPSWGECSSYLCVDRNAFSSVTLVPRCHLSSQQPEDGTVEITDLLYEYCDTVYPRHWI